jgi:hypothetical protein
MGDLILWMRVGVAGPVIRVDDPLASWRRHPGGITIQTSLDRAREHLRLVQAGETLLSLPDEATAVRAEALRNACVIAAFFGGDPGGPNTGRFMSIDLQRPQISSFGAGLGQGDLLDERAAEAGRLWRELARLTDEVGALRVSQRGEAPPDSRPAGLEAAMDRLRAVGILASDRGAGAESATHAEVHLALWQSAFMCAGDTEPERSRYLLIDRQAEAFSEDELGLLTNNAFHSSVPQLRSAVDRLRRELESSRNRPSR